MSPYELQCQHLQRRVEPIFQEKQKEISEFLGFRDQKEDCMFKSFVESLDDPKNAPLKERFVNEKWTVSSDDSDSLSSVTASDTHDDLGSDYSNGSDYSY